jgi:hypothetical protein
MKRRMKMVLALGLVLVGASVFAGCVNGKDYYVTVGTGTYVNIRETPTLLIETVVMPQCNWDRYCVAYKLSKLDDNKFWQRATDQGEATDMWKDALEPAFWNHSRCPTFKITTSGSIDWMTHSCHW